MSQRYDGNITIEPKEKKYAELADNPALFTFAGTILRKKANTIKFKNKSEILFWLILREIKKEIDIGIKRVIKENLNAIPRANKNARKIVLIIVRA